MRIIYLVLASDNQEHRIDESAQRQTWAKNCLDQVIWLRGGTEIFFDEFQRSLTVAVTEEYDNILEKTIAGIHWCLTNMDFDYLIRANVSTYFSVEMMRQELVKLGIATPSFGGKLDLINQKEMIKKDRLFVNGGAIMLNKPACKVLINLNPKVFKGKADDWAITHFLINRKVIPIPIQRSNVSISSLLRLKPYFRLKSSNAPEVASKRMKLINEVMNSQSLKQRLSRIILFQYFELKNFPITHGSMREYIRGLYGITSVKLQTMIILRKINV